MDDSHEVIVVIRRRADPAAPRDRAEPGESHAVVVGGGGGLDFPAIDAVVVSRTPDGWWARERKTGAEHRLTDRDWRVVGGWELRTARGGDWVDEIGDRSSRAPELRVHDAAHPIDPPFVVRLSPAEGERLVVGRNPAEAELVLTDASVSRRHLLLYRRDGRTWARNLSRFAACVNGAPLVHDRPLANGDRIAIGESLLRFWERSEPARAGPVGIAAILITIVGAIGGWILRWRRRR